MKNILIKLIFFSTSMIIMSCDLMIKKDQAGKKPHGVDNVILEARDRGESDPEEDRTVYYKIFLDKELAAKTTSGLFFQKKKLSLHLSPGRYMFFAERWYLEEASGSEVPEYKRANNVWQMKPIYIDVPEGSETFKMVFGFDHDKKEFYYKIEGQSESIPEIIEHFE